MNQMEGGNERLEAARGQALQRLTYLTGDLNSVIEASREHNKDDENDPRGATIAVERAHRVGAWCRK